MGSPSLSVKAVLVVVVDASTSAPQPGARRLCWPGSIQFTESEGEPLMSPFRRTAVRLYQHPDFHIPTAPADSR